MPMSATWGRRLRITVFGESHGPAVGVVIDGMPPGTPVEEEAIAMEMARRAPGGDYVSGRHERDVVTLQSGVYEGRCTGAPIALLIHNENARPADYGQMPARPSHGDYALHMRFGGYNDPRGGGHGSGRVTAALVAAGAIARPALTRMGVSVSASLAQAGPVLDVQGEADHAPGREELFMYDAGAREKAAALFAQLQAEGDSVGGTVQAVATGIPAGWGSPFFASAESAISALLFSIPGVKGVEFGAGMAFAGMRGSQANDAFCDSAKTLTNESGGINGGVTNGMPLIVRAAFRPTPSIAKEQSMLDLETKKAVRHAITGRHDPCIALRAVPVVEAALLLALLDMALEGKALEGKALEEKALEGKADG